MAKIVCVHGIGQQQRTRDELETACLESLRKGLTAIDSEEGWNEAARLTRDDVAVAYYGDLYVDQADALGPGEPRYRIDDLTDFEKELLFLWWQAAADVDARVPDPGAETLFRTPRSIQAGLRALTRSRTFAHATQRMMIGNLIQVRRYFTEEPLRKAITSCVADRVTAETRVLIGHSLGSVVAYESLFLNADWPVRTLVTLGSPLGIKNLVFHKLLPSPEVAEDGPAGSLRGRWPSPATSWTNIADPGDVVALVRLLRPLFGPDTVDDRSVHNGWKSHELQEYLAREETGRAVLTGLRP
jgi:hypothetical protein